MTEKIEEFIRRIHQEHLDSLTLEEIREIRDRLLGLEERLRGLTPEERLRVLKPEDVVKCFTPEELRQLKDYLKTLH